VAKIVSVPDNEMKTWKGRVTCGNYDCRALLEVTGADLYRAAHNYSDWGGMADKPEPVYELAATCPVCKREWLLSFADRQTVPPSVSRQIPYKPAHR
jgi:hypothetical protein